jgi:hypothetical protein
MLLIESLPEFSRELTELLITAREPDLAAQMLFPHPENEKKMGAPIPGLFPGATVDEQWRETRRPART